MEQRRGMRRKGGRGERVVAGHRRKPWWLDTDKAEGAENRGKARREQGNMDMVAGHRWAEERWLDTGTVPMMEQQVGMTVCCKEQSDQQ